MKYAIGDEYDTTATHKRQYLSIWSGEFYSDYEGMARSLPKGNGYMVTTYNGDKVRVSCPCPRTDSNYAEIDAAINAALNAHETARGTVTIGTSTEVTA